MFLPASSLVLSASLQIGLDAEDGLMLSSCVWVCPYVILVDESQGKELGGAGYIILIASRNPALSYFAVYMATW